MVMDERSKVSHLQQQQHSHRVGIDTGVSEHELDREETTTVEGLSSTESSSPPPSTNGVTAGDGPNGPVVNVYLIGLEFVRQYYTVLHQGPLYLHRFYSEDSSFVHDDSKAVYGQVEIRERIQQLNFCNCVAKILQVDSHETVGNGVVIQVRGELSNNGQPMRRFMQTFVLAPQSPKRFYVRNDIFHYQDDLTSKDEFKPIDRSSVDLIGNEDADDEKSDGDEEPIKLNNSSSTASNNTTSADVEDQQTLNASFDSAPNETLMEERNERQKDGFVSPTQSAAEGEGSKTTSTTSSSGSGLKDNVSIPASISPAMSPEATTGGPVAKTYANLFKSGPTVSNVGVAQVKAGSPFPAKSTAGTPSGGTPAPTTLSPPSDHEDVRSPPTASPQPPVSDGQAISAAAVVKNLPPARGGGQYGSYGRGDRGYHRDRRENRERLASRSSTANDDTGSVDGDGNGRRSNTNYPDTHQLFVGNLPHSVTQQEVKGIFEVYGKVAEVKILKPNQKSAGSKVPYFCFVIFEEAAAAAAAINEKTKITMRMADGTNRRLNVEEKRARGDLGGFAGQNFSRDSRENVSNSQQGGNGGGGNQFRRGDGGGGGNNSNRPSNPPPGVNDRNQGGPHRGRTFRGRGGGGGGGGGAR